MKAITKIFILAAGTGLGIGVGKHMSQMGEKDNTKIKEFLNETEYYTPHEDESNNDEEFAGTVKKLKKIREHTGSLIKKLKTQIKKDLENDVNSENLNETADGENFEENEDAEPVEIKPPTKEEEIEWGKNYFSYLLPLTEEAVENKDKENETFDYRYVFEGWMYALDGDCEILLSDFNSIISDIIHSVKF